MSTVTFRVRVLSVCVHWNFQIIWTVFQIDVKISDACKRKVFSVDVPNNHSLERENSNFTGGLFQGLNLYDAQVCVRVSNDHFNKSIVVAGLFEVSDARSRHDQGGTTVMGKNMKSSWTTMFIFCCFVAKFLSSALGGHPLRPPFMLFPRTVLCFSLSSKSFYLYLSKLLTSLFLQR